METKSPTLLMLEAMSEKDRKERLKNNSDLPGAGTGCRYCEYACWQVMDQRVVCRCAKFGNISWSTWHNNEAGVWIPMCDVQLLQEIRERQASPNQ